MTTPTVHEVPPTREGCRSEFTDADSKRAQAFAMTYPEVFGKYIGTVARTFLTDASAERDALLAFALTPAPSALEYHEPSPLELRLVSILTEGK